MSVGAHVFQDALSNCASAELEVLQAIESAPFEEGEERAMTRAAAGGLHQ